MNKNIILLTISLFTLLPGCFLKDLFGNKKDQASLYVINVLDKPFYDDCHIKGSTSVPFEKINSFTAGLNKDTELVIYCSNYMCTASGQVASDLIAKGFKHVWAYEAGMADWAQKGFPVEGQCKKPYLTAENKPHDEQASVPVIAAQELKEKMEKAGLLSK